jgi:hypothetical protein
MRLIEPTTPCSSLKPLIITFRPRSTKHQKGDLAFLPVRLEFLAPRQHFASNAQKMLNGKFGMGFMNA